TSGVWLPIKEQGLSFILTSEPTRSDPRLHEDGSAGILQGLLFQVFQLWPLDHQKELADIPEISHAWTVEHSTYLLRLHYYHEEVSPSS
ncbi:Phospholipase A1-IIdelta, partial [Frankliniella fusca]